MALPPLALQTDGEDPHYGCPTRGDTISNWLSSKLDGTPSEDMSPGLTIESVPLPLALPLFLAFPNERGATVDTGVRIVLADSCDESVDDCGAGLRRVNARSSLGADEVNDVSMFDIELRDCTRECWLMRYSAGRSGTDGDCKMLVDDTLPFPLRVRPAPSRTLGLRRRGSEIESADDEPSEPFFHLLTSDLRTERFFSAVGVPDAPG